MFYVCASVFCVCMDSFVCMCSCVARRTRKLQDECSHVFDERIKEEGAAP